LLRELVNKDNKLIVKSRQQKNWNCTLDKHKLFSKNVDKIQSINILKAWVRIKENEGLKERIEIHTHTYRSMLTKS
jgi:hypothetical protein